MNASTPPTLSVYHSINQYLLTCIVVTVSFTEKSKRLSTIPPGESSVQEMSKSLNLQHPQSQGTKYAVSGNVMSLNLTRISPANPDEFKYGFPSDGLSRISFPWWDNSNGHDGNRKTHLPNSKDKPDSKIQVKIGRFGGGGSENEIQTTINDTSTTSSLSDLRKKAVKEGKTALKLGVYKGHGINKLDSYKRSILVQIFKSSLPSQWTDGVA